MERPDLTGLTVEQAMYIAYLEGKNEGVAFVIEATNKTKSIRTTKETKEEITEETEEQPINGKKQIKGNVLEHVLNSKA